MDHIEITRANFERVYGFKPEPCCTGMVFYAPDGRTPLTEVSFIDDEPVSAGYIRDIAELERIFAL